ncbi:MAG: hypothetical protein KY428_00575 [Bacteroidetes bacterium]|nr:hypothetical protein [Bacteroidota bacterium]
MKARHLYMLIITLYIMAALSLLGMGSARHKLQQLQAVEQAQLQDSTAAPQLAEEREESTEAEDRTTSLVQRSPEKQELHNKLTLWQIIAILFFAAASLLLVYKEKLVQKPATKPE